MEDQVPVSVVPHADIRHKNSSGLFNLYDGWNQLKCGAHVSFREQTPAQVETNGVDPEEIEWELEDLGFDGVQVDTFSGYCTFDDEIKGQLARLGLYNPDSFGHGISMDYAEDSAQVVLYDTKFRSMMSPVRASRALRSVKTTLQYRDFWGFMMTWRPKNWIVSLQESVKYNRVLDCPLDMSDIQLILQAYHKLNAFGQKCFNKWTCGDIYAMLELAKRVIGVQA